MIAELRSPRHVQNHLTRVSPDAQPSQFLQGKPASLLQRLAPQLQPAVTSRAPNLHPQRLLSTVPVPDQEVLLRHESRAALLHPKQVGESLRSTERFSTTSTARSNQRLRLFDL